MEEYLWVKHWRSASLRKHWSLREQKQLAHDVSANLTRENRIGMGWPKAR